MEEGEEAQDSDSSCSASFTLGFPDGTTATLDSCERFSLEATYGFDPLSSLRTCPGRPERTVLVLEVSVWLDLRLDTAMQA